MVVLNSVTITVYMWIIFTAESCVCIGLHYVNACVYVCVYKRTNKRLYFN